MTKEEVNRKHILRQEGKETNLIEERNRLLQENQKKEEKPKEKTKSNMFGNLKKVNDQDSDDEHSDNEEESNTNNVHYEV